MRVLQNVPLCAVCKVGVARLEEHEVWDDRVRFKAYCHGQVEVVEVRANELRHVVFGEAFRTVPQLPPAPEL